MMIKCNGNLVIANGSMDELIAEMVKIARSIRIAINKLPAEKVKKDEIKNYMINKIIDAVYDDNAEDGVTGMTKLYGQQDEEPETVFQVKEAGEKDQAADRNGGIAAYTLEQEDMATDIDDIIAALDELIVKADENGEEVAKKILVFAKPLILAAKKVIAEEEQEQKIVMAIKILSNLCANVKGGLMG